MNLLLVEDEAIARLDIREGLQHKGHDVTSVSTGELAMEMVLHNHYDAMVLDLNLGKGMNGLDVIAELIKRNQLPPVVVTSAYDPKYVEGVKGVACFINKPTTADEVDQALRQCVANGVHA